MVLNISGLLKPQEEIRGRLPYYVSDPIIREKDGQRELVVVVKPSKDSLVEQEIVLPMVKLIALSKEQRCSLLASYVVAVGNKMLNDQKAETPP